MNILAIDTATEACSAALLINSEVTERFEIAPREQAHLILPMVEGLLADNGITLSQLDALAFGRGPGGFTGVRIATGVVQGIAYGADLPVIPVSTLTALAQGAYRLYGKTRLIPAIDARISEVYWSACEIMDSRAVPCIDACVIKPERAPLPEGDGWYGIGTGWGAYENTLTQRLGKQLAGWSAMEYPHAQDIALLAADALKKGETVSADKALPEYLRNDVAVKSR